MAFCFSYGFQLRPRGCKHVLSAAPVGRLPPAAETLLMTGTKIPAARAVVLGMPGASAASPSASDSASERVEPPKVRTSSSAMRSPSPVFVRAYGGFETGRFETGNDSARVACSCRQLHPRAR